MKVTWHTAKYGDPYSKFVLCIYPSKVHTHSSEHTHTPWTHTRSSGQPFMLRRLGSSWGFGAMLKGTSVVVLRVERVLYIHSLHLQFLPARDSNLWITSSTLTIRPRLPKELHFTKNNRQFYNCHFFKRDILNDVCEQKMQPPDGAVFEISTIYTKSMVMCYLLT